MSHTITWEKEEDVQGVLVQFRGIFDYKGYIGANCEIYGDTRSNSLSYIIRDLSGITTHKLTNQELSVIATYDQVTSLRLPKKIKLGLIAQNQDILSLCHIFCAQYQCRLSGWEYMVADRMEKIRTWTNAEVITCSYS